MDDMNRYVFCKGSISDYLLNKETGDMWVILVQSGTIVFKPIPVVDNR